MILIFELWKFELTCTFTRDQCRPPLAMGRHGPPCQESLRADAVTEDQWRGRLCQVPLGQSDQCWWRVDRYGSVNSGKKYGKPGVEAWTKLKYGGFLQNFPCSHSWAGVGNWGGSLSDQRSGKECILQRVIGRTQLQCIYCSGWSSQHQEHEAGQ